MSTSQDFLKTEHQFNRVKVNFSTQLNSLYNELDNGTGPDDDDSNHESKDINTVSNLSFEMNLTSKWLTKIDLQHTYLRRKTSNLPDTDHPNQKAKSSFYGQVHKAKWTNPLLAKQRQKFKCDSAFWR